MTYNQIIQKPGKRIKKHVYYIVNGETINVNDESVERIKFDTQTPLIGTSINGCEIILKEPINGEIYVRVDATYKKEVKSEIYGPYNLKEEPIYDANKKTYLHKCYDNLLKSMINYQPITMTYPCTIFQFFTRLCIEIGYTNNILNLPNGNIQMANDIYTGINYTYRDVLDDIAIANGVLFYIDNNEIKIATLGGDTITIDDDILKNKNIEFGKHYGPINSIVLSRSAGTDNIYIKDDESIEEYGLHEFKISDNQLMNGNNRDAFLPNLLLQLGGIEYDIYDTELIGYGKVRPLQSINFETSNNTYNSYIFNNEITLTTGYKQSIYNDLPKQTETDYKTADITDRRINQTQLIVDKQQGIIESLVSNTTYVSDTKTGVGSIQLENAYESQLYKLSIKGNISLLFPQSNVQYGYPLVPHNNLTPSNTLTPSNPVPYENEIHYPSSQLFSKSSNLIIDETEYELDFDFLNYMSTTIYDEFIYDNGTCYIIRRVGIDSEGNMYALDNEVIEPRKSIVLQIKNNSTISLKSFNNAILSATYLLDNIYTDNFATEVYVQSEIKQTADEINLQVSKKVNSDEIISAINLTPETASINADKIKLEGYTTINNNFSIDNNGNVHLQGGDINLKDTDDKDNSKFTISNALDRFAVNEKTVSLLSGEISFLNRTSDTSFSSMGISSSEPEFYISHTIEVNQGIMEDKSIVLGYNGLSITNYDEGGSEWQFAYYKYNEAKCLGNIYANSFVQTSLAKYKKNIQKSNINALEEIKKLDVYEFNYKSENDKDKKHIGFVIGDDYKVSNKFISNNGEGIDTANVVGILTKAIKEQQAIIEDLTQRIEKLERESDK